MTEFLRKITKQDVRNTLALVWTMGSFWFLFKLLSNSIPPENQSAINVIGGMVIGNLGLIISFYYGTSKTETDKAKNDAE